VSECSDARSDSERPATAQVDSTCEHMMLAFCVARLAA
jgi:hypothetical protein